MSATDGAATHQTGGAKLHTLQIPQSVREHPIAMRRPKNTPESIRQNIAARKAREAAQQQAAQDRPSVGFVDGWIVATELPPSTIVVSKTGMFHRAGCPHLTAYSNIDSTSVVRLPAPEESPGESGPKCSNGYCWG